VKQEGEASSADRTTYLSVLPGPARVHRHYKGGRYLLLAVAETHNHNGDRDAIYVSLSKGKIVTRPWVKDGRNEDAWNDVVRWPDGVERLRFTTFAPGADPFENDPNLYPPPA
jgi:hypothetical protein